MKRLCQKLVFFQGGSSDVQKMWNVSKYMPISLNLGYTSTETHEHLLIIHAVQTQNGHSQTRALQSISVLFCEIAIKYVYETDHSVEHFGEAHGLVPSCIFNSLPLQIIRA